MDSGDTATRVVPLGDAKAAPLTDSTADALRPAAALLSTWYAVLACMHLVLLAGTARVVMTTAAVVTSFLLAGLWRRLADVVRPDEAPVIGSMVATLVSVNSLLHLWVTGDPAQTTNVIITVIGTGALVHDRRWAAGVVLLTCAGWGAIALAAPPDEQWFHFAIALFSATGVSALLNHTRTRTVLRLAALEASMRRAAVTDELTGLANRRGLLAAGRPLVLAAARAGTPVTVVYLDVDGLKQVNDTEGHAAGDRLLTRAASALSVALREADVLARVGGDEFAAVLAGTGADDVDVPLDRMHRRLAEVGVSASYGLAHNGAQDVESLESLLERADAAMYEAKRAQRAGR